MSFLLDGKERHAQPVEGHRTGIEPVLLAACIPARPGERVLEGGTWSGAALLCPAHRVPGVVGLGIEVDAAMAAVLVEAHDDVLVLDLMQNPKFAANERVRGLLGTLTPVVNVAGLSTEGDFLILQLRASPFGIPRALSAARQLAAG